MIYVSAQLLLIAERAAVSLTQSEEVRRNTSGPSDSPERENLRGKENVGEDILQLGGTSFMKFGSSKSSFGTNDAPTDLGSFLGEDTDINGEVKFTEIMRVDASISGTITSDSGSLLITEKGRVKATIQAGIVEVSGIVEGTITAKTSVKIHSTGRVYGDIHTPVLIIEYGAVFDGKCNMINGRDQAKSFSKIEQKPLEQKPIAPMPVEPKPFPDPKPLKRADTI